MQNEIVLLCHWPHVAELSCDTGFAMSLKFSDVRK